MIKSILVPIDDSPYSRTALEYALDLADLYKAKLSVLYVMDAKVLQSPQFPTILSFMELPPFPELQIKLEKALEKIGKRLLNKAEKQAQKRGLPCETYLAGGVLEQIISEEAKKVDLVCMGARGEKALSGSPFLGTTVESVVRMVDKPVLLCHKEHRKVKHPLVAHDGSPRADNALRIAADIASKAKLPMTLLTVSDSKEKGLKILSAAQEYAKSYKVETEALLRPGDPAYIILSTAEEKKCDLILMGAYGHAKFYELILGSVTEQVMRKSRVPVLLYR